SSPKTWPPDEDIDSLDQFSVSILTVKSERNSGYKSYGTSSSANRSEVNDNYVDYESNETNDDNLMEVLDNFRENWRRELESTKNCNHLRQ
ncbi:unnamed protein product, partial [Medioppia subpectinata]